MKRLTKITFITILLIGCIFNAEAQKFQWVKGGGAATSSDQHTDFMCTDPNGNVYALSTVGGDAPLIADTFHSSFYYGTNPIILITSYNCNGQMRWAKLIGSNSGSCTPFGIAADSLGHIYVAGLFSNQTLYIGNDTTIAAYIDLATGLVQFDTLGHFHWIRYVGENNLSTLLSTVSLSNPLTIDNANNAHYFVYMSSGLIFIPGDTSRYGVYDMTYNASGTLLSHVRLDLDSEWFLHGAVIDPVTNKLYVCGEVNQSLYVGIIDTFFAAAFDANRNRLWQYPGIGGSTITGVALDPIKQLYFSGNASPYFVGETTFSFNDDSVSAPYNNLAIILKTDTNGHVNWIQHFDSHSSVNYFNSVALLPNHKIAVAGTFGGEVKFGFDSLIVPAGEYLNPYLAIVDSAGDLEMMQQMKADGLTAGYNLGNVIVSDRIGNLYIGGSVEDSIWGGNLPAYHTVGGNSDFWVMKYGVDCSCTSMPIAAPFTDTGTHTIGFSYTGSTTGLDSVVWNFDDGSTTTGTTALHTYSVAGTYRACVTIYTACGSDLYCKNVVVLIPSLVVSNQSALSDVKVWPNPVNDELNISGINENTTYKIINLTGVSIQDGYLKPGTNRVPLEKFSTGIYILELTGESGVRNIVRVVKE
jgi:hypothetical protein